MVLTVNEISKRGKKAGKKIHVYFVAQNIIFKARRHLRGDMGFWSLFHVTVKKITRQPSSLLANQVLCGQKMLKAKICPRITCSFFCTLSSDLFWASSTTLYTAKVPLPYPPLLSLQSGEGWRAEFKFQNLSEHLCIRCHYCFPSSPSEYEYISSSFTFTHIAWAE